MMAVNSLEIVPESTKKANQVKYSELYSIVPIFQKRTPYSIIDQGNIKSQGTIGNILEHNP